jgi:SAM-dependent methyltransferase
MSADPNAFAYDRVAYPTRPQSQIHPERLAALGYLFGLEPAPVGGSRVLEIGCGDARNLAPVAAAFPGSRCVGVDHSGAAIERGREFSRRCGLANLELYQADVAVPGAVEGEFDYILCHGVYSWVPAEVREGILRVCRERLAPDGLALVSYNALPGACVRSEIRNLLRWHVRDLTDSAERLEEARALIRFLGGALLEGDEIRAGFRAELRVAEEKEPGFLFHDELSEHYAPLYFHEFMAAASRHQLQFVADADPAELSLLHIPVETRNVVGALTPDRVERQQYLDFLVARRFRHTVLCRAERPVSAEMLVDPVARCWFSSHGATAEPKKAGAPNPIAGFERAGGLRLETDFVPGQWALRCLIAESPRRRSFPDLLGQVRVRLREAGEAGLDTPEMPDRLARFLVEAGASRVVTIHGAAPECPPVPGERPRSFPVARVEAADGPMVTSVFHQSIRLEDRWGREILTRADGTRTVEMIASELDALAASGSVTAAEAELWRSIRSDLPGALGRFAHRGLLVG